MDILSPISHLVHLYAFERHGTYFCDDSHTLQVVTKIRSCVAKPSKPMGKGTFDCHMMIAEVIMLHQ